MKLKDILRDVEVERIVGPKEVEVEALCMDSRMATRGTLFAAIEGSATDGHKFIGSAVERGASVVVCNHLPQEVTQSINDEQCPTDGLPQEEVTYVVVKDSSLAVGIIASNFYGRPSEKLALVGVTGTNGKTTTATLLYNLVGRLGYQAGLISTVVYKIGSQEEPSTHTTPDAINLNRLLARMVDAGCAYCFMEVSSHSLVQHRTAGLHFAGAIFSNLTHDHLDYHGTFAEYIKAKKTTLRRSRQRELGSGECGRQKR